jgi:nickel/cobalt transporter (NicO) family protein
LIEILPLLAAAALVGVLHMSAPDHWVTLCVLAQASKWSRARLLGFGLVAGAGHVALSVLLGFAIVAAGLLFSTQTSTELALATGVLMVVGGLGYAAISMLRAGKGTGGTPAEDAAGRGLTYFAVLGAALSPDLSILPIFLLAVPIGLGLALDAAAVFAVASVATLLLLLMVGSIGLARVFSRIPERYNDALVGLVLAVVGAYVILSA